MKSLALTFTLALALPTWPATAAEESAKPAPPAPAEAPTAKASVKGDLLSKGTKIALTHAAAYEVDSPSERGQLDVVVVLSDRPLTREVALDQEKLQALMSAKKLTALRVTLNSDCKVRSAAPYHPSMRNYVSSGAMITWEPSAFTTSMVAGRFLTPGEPELAGETWSYDLTFSCPITLDPKAVTVPDKPAKKGLAKPAEKPTAPPKKKAAKKE